MSAIGDNSRILDDTLDVSQDVLNEANVATDDQLRLFIERIERMEEEKKAVADDIRDTYNEAKSQGYDSKIMRQIIKIRKMPVNDRKEMEAVLEVYKAALGID